jgi:hypothetical protein
VTPEQRELIAELLTFPGRKPAMSHDEFLEAFSAEDGMALAVDLLSDAIDRVAEDVERSLVVAFAFGFTEECLPLLTRLSSADWHKRVEDVASGLQQMRSPNAVGALSHLALWVPEYLEWDDARALAVKAIWALGDTPGRAATDARHREFPSR